MGCAPRGGRGGLVRRLCSSPTFPFPPPGGRCRESQEVCPIRARHESGPDVRLISSLGLEITETALIRDAEATVADLNRLRSLGVRLAIDDFGTGFSSLSWLRRCPVDQLKIDSSFVAGVGWDPEDTAIVESCLALARALGHGAVAEGVQTEPQVAVLREMGCNLGQGYFLARPRPAEDQVMSTS